MCFEEVTGAYGMMCIFKYYTCVLLLLITGVVFLFTVTIQPTFIATLDVRGMSSVYWCTWCYGQLY